MAFRTISEFEQILRETPAAARYLDLYWCKANTAADWSEIASMMMGAMDAVQFGSEAHGIYDLLRGIAKQHRDRSTQLVRLEVAA